ncbi:hypothetical protein Golax_015898, partial [Gossypium laxum]|nr:hypothetical protein [Gossypium laxum]
HNSSHSNHNTEIAPRCGRNTRTNTFDDKDLLQKEILFEEQLKQGSTYQNASMVNSQNSNSSSTFKGLKYSTGFGTYSWSTHNTQPQCFGKHAVNSQGTPSNSKFSTTSSSSTIPTGRQCAREVKRFKCNGCGYLSCDCLNRRLMISYGHLRCRHLESTICRQL